MKSTCIGIALACAIGLGLSHSACHAASDFSLDRVGLPQLKVGGITALSSRFVFWSKGWTWTNTTTKLSAAGSDQHLLSARNETLAFDLIARINKASPRKMVWDFGLTGSRTTTDITGGGLSFELNPDLYDQLGEPQLLPGRKGWMWGRTNGPRIEVLFEPAVKALYFEPGRKSEIRAFFYSKEVTEGEQRYAMTVSVSDQVTIGPSSGERFGVANMATWPSEMLGAIAPWNSSPVDLSFLNGSEKPAGKRGFLKAENDRLVFEDGTPARFWGTNITSYALFGTGRDNVRIQARRLAQLGFNLVRLHHHDSEWVEPNIFGEKGASNTLNLSPAMLEKLDWWIKCLKDEGIYIWLDLHVGRQFKAGDGIENFDEISKGKQSADLKGYNYVNTSIQRAMQRFNEDYLNHLNSFTGLKYKDEPAIAAVMITNENDLTFHFGNALLPDKKVPRHSALYMAQANAFAAKTGLSKDAVWRSWEHGPSKMFLGDLESRFNKAMIGHLRSLGLRAPLVTTSSWGFNPLSSLPPLTDGDIIDAHSYGGALELEKNPIFGPTFIHWLAAAQIVDRPMSVTEWNVSPFPAPDRHSAPLYVAGTASFQGWDAIMQYAYAQQPPVGRGNPSNWDMFNDPGMISMMPAAALLYRRGDVREAETTYVLAPGREKLFFKAITPANSVAIRTATEKGKLVIAMPRTPELPWLQESKIPLGSQVITDPNLSLLDPNAKEAVSDTGEVRRNWEQGIYAIDTRRSQMVTGWIGGKDVRLSDVSVSVKTPNASVAVQSLDEKRISESHSILISLGARAVPAHRNGETVFRSEPVTGSITVRAPQGLKFHAGRARKEIPFSYRDGQYTVELAPDLGSYWLFLER